MYTEEPGTSVGITHSCKPSLSMHNQWLSQSSNPISTSCPHFLDKPFSRPSSQRWRDLGKSNKKKPSFCTECCFFLFGKFVQEVERDFGSGPPPSIFRCVHIHLIKRKA
ncbi:hypothetical protein Mp_4g18840 [Marchantia polymorpha subsp. ruderalis]|uniref:Uncharacterized protein n=2 Tax=Marchantia polymorpha TaxID=3197 RepID=A0AAF6BBD9_MARPO|nr:hypothetical protein MARPO_0164s0027 [Marchantia polymorpha]BBN09323.1 hypothetical protein Mp_4g18840 [Marchantia polymorpha subsp. ruderalis]|eukprot:PTQ28434.1 hypothetical protein MARPO_0164s0027 [Marchantia polymorpha]